jgi:hypothetical protein
VESSTAQDEVRLVFEDELIGLHCCPECVRHLNPVGDARPHRALEGSMAVAAGSLCRVHCRVGVGEELRPSMWCLIPRP